LILILQASTVEKRQGSRHKSFLRGFVYFANSPSAIDCTVRDISDAGARLKFSGVPSATETLTLNIPIKGQTLNAKAIWQHADEIGISFVSTSAVGAPLATDTELSVRVEKLEAEITLLKQIIMRLQNNASQATDAA
jgi:hypothetical protein